MSDPGENNAIPDAAAKSRDGTLDFSSYSLQQLRELELIIDRTAQPLTHANLLAEMSRRASVTTSDREGPGVAGQFSAASGWLGWLDAKRRRSPVHGPGHLELDEQHVTLHGWQRTWLGVREPAIVQLPLDKVCNVTHDGHRLEFTCKQRFRPARRIRFQTGDADASTLAQQLPRTQTRGFGKRWQEMRTYQTRIAALGGNAWPVYALVLANILAFLVMAISEKRASDFDFNLLIRWGGNFGPAVMDGQWWRLISAQFLHEDPFHLIANMWVLLNVGRLARQLYGSAAFLALYFGAGVCGYVTSIAWNPGAVAIGASGAVFGVLGAFLAFLLRQRAQLPAALLRAHWLSTLVFVVFNLITGVVQPNIDNAAHVGGLLSGLALGALMARPLLPEARATWPLWRYAASLSLVAGIALAGFLQVRGIGLQPNSVQAFARDHEWYAKGEHANLQQWQQLAGRASVGAISDAELSRQFLTELLPFWRDAHQQLSAEPQFKESKPGTFPAVLLEFVGLRRDWASAIGDAAANRDEQRGAEAVRLMQQTGRLQAQLERHSYRAHMEYRPRALAHSLAVNRIRAFLNPRGWKCIEAPSNTGRVISPQDSAEDSPALARELGCRAQRYFYERDYQSLENLMRGAAEKLDDLPDGSSSLAAIFGSLSEFMFYGTHDLESLMGRTADWRRAVKDPLMAELVEVLVFREWAWSARGQAYAKEVSGQSWAVFAHRTQMAAAGLDWLKESAAGSPLWHDLSVDVALDLSEDVPEIRAIFARGAEKFPAYLPLYASMMRVLQPRWLGSHEEVDQFISDQTRRGVNDQDLELYALLYWRYFLLEQDNTNIFVEARASWTNMDIGFIALRERRPGSDYLLNTHAFMACLAVDADRYGELRPQLDTRLSQSVWSRKYSLATCDREMRFKD